MEIDAQDTHRLSRRGLVRAGAGAAALGAAAVAAGRTPAQASAEGIGHPGRPGHPGFPGDPGRFGHPGFPGRPGPGEPEGPLPILPVYGPEEPIVVYIRDARTGELEFSVGDRRVEVWDRVLTARLIAAAR
jgi:hypothetical protein